MAAGEDENGDALRLAASNLERDAGRHAAAIGPSLGEATLDRW